MASQDGYLSEKPAGTRRERSVDWLREKPGVVLIDSQPFDLEHTLTSGQAFRWRRYKRGQGFVGVVGGRMLWLEQRGDRVLYRCLGGEFRPLEVRRYLGLDGVHAEAVRSFPRDDILGRAVKEFPGMRVLQQDPWETLISFIISSNNNIARIRNCIESLCRTFGEEIEGGSGFYSFPTPESLRGAPLRIVHERCKLGYREKYVKGTAKQVAGNPKLLREIARLPYDRARKEIMRLPGVGRKVADCVLLYSMGKLEAFPIDTWTRKVVEEEYLGRRGVPMSEIRAFVRGHFGCFAGYAQLYLFHYARMSEARA